LNAVCGGHHTQPLHLAQRADQGEVAARPDVRPAQGHEQVDVGAPRADAFLFNELEADRLVLERAEAGRIELAVHDRARERTDVASFLPAEADRPQCHVVELQPSRRGRRSDERLEPVVGRARGGEGDLLLEDDVHEGAKAGLAGPQRRRAEALDDGSEVAVAPTELGNAARERLFGQLCGRGHTKNVAARSGRCVASRSASCKAPSAPRPCCPNSGSPARPWWCRERASRPGSSSFSPTPLSPGGTATAGRSAPASAPSYSLLRARS